MCKREKERESVCVDEEAIELMVCDVGATPWEPGPEMAGKPSDARECRNMRKRAVLGPVPELSLKHDMGLRCCIRTLTCIAESMRGRPRSIENCIPSPAIGAAEPLERPSLIPVYPNHEDSEETWKEPSL